MTIKQLAKRVLPPIFVDILKCCIKAMGLEEARKVPPDWEYVPEGWRHADPHVKGWNDRSVLEVQKAKWPETLQLVQDSKPLVLAREDMTPSERNYSVHNTFMCYAYALALTARKRDSLSLLDWGGGLGFYYLLSKALLPGVEIDYHCKELPLLCEEGRRLFPNATFYDDEECFKRSYDLALVSGSLQYVEDWRGTIARLASVSRSYLYVTRLPIVLHAPSFVVVQRPSGYNTEYLCWSLNRKEFLDHLLTLKLDLLREFLIDDRPTVYNAPEQGEYRGFLFHARERT